METKVNKKAFETLGLIWFLFFMIPATAFSWSQATHAYISQRLGARVGYDNMNEMWGSVAPDMFIFTFDPAVCPTWITDQTHGTYSETFLKVWNASSTNAEDALAFGFVSHNQQWGADHTAHVSGLTFGQEDGYIIANAKVLLKTPLKLANPHRTFGKVFASIGMNPYEQLMVAHLITEYAIDIMLTNDADPLLGQKVEKAAQNRSKKFPALLVKAFAVDYAAYCFGGDYSTAAYIITAAEEEHRNNMIFLGQAISQSEPVPVQLLAEQVVGVLPDFLDAPLPISEAEAVELMKAAIIKSMDICDDYMAEIDVTIEFVDKNLKDHGLAIRGDRHPFDRNVPRKPRLA